MDGTAYIGLGSNLGERTGFLRQALHELIRRGLDVAAVSALYETDPMYVEDQPAFLNAAARLDRAPSPPVLLAELHRVERLLGRERTRRFGPRTIDLDILLWGADGALVHAAPDLTIPHPRLLERAFALAPLADVASHLVHPLCGRTVGELAQRVGSQSAVRRIQVDWSGLPR